MDRMQNYYCKIFRLSDYVTKIEEPTLYQIWLGGSGVTRRSEKVCFLSRDSEPIVVTDRDRCSLDPEHTAKLEISVPQNYIIRHKIDPLIPDLHTPRSEFRNQPTTEKPSLQKRLKTKEQKQGLNKQKIV